MTSRKEELKHAHREAKKQEHKLKLKRENSSIAKLGLVVNHTVSDAVYYPIWRMLASENQLQTATEDTQLNVEFLKARDKNH